MGAPRDDACLPASRTLANATLWRETVALGNLMWLKCPTEIGVATAGAPAPRRPAAAAGLGVCMTDSGSGGKQTRSCVIGVTQEHSVGSGQG